jgi:cytochrome c oxidase assembly protein subunit 15
MYMIDQVELQLRHRYIIALWLFGVAFMVFIMVVLGGVTRLTHSGLSMVEWHPITGWLPPLNDIEWERIFREYQSFPEFLKVNNNMSVSEFKGIFWLEYLHRLWGRLIGVAFFFPFVFFLIRGWVRGAQIIPLLALLVLGGLQGGMGWFMVKSGLVDHPDVSQYHLAAHLTLALLIYTSLLWYGLFFFGAQQSLNPKLQRLRRFSVAFVALVFATASSGALVAGLDAGLSYNTFPLMDGQLIPDGLFVQSPFYMNFFENLITVQFDHRVLAFLTLCGALYFWFKAKKYAALECDVRPITYLFAAVCCQVMLGALTLFLVVPVPLAALHQAGVLVVLGIATWTMYFLQN